DEVTSRACFDRFVEGRGNFFDTASTYTDGNSERLLGQFMGSDRDRFVVASKVTLCSPAGSRHPGDPNATGNNRKHLREELETSLRQLGTDRLDVLYLHAWDFATPILDVMRTLNEFVTSGKVAYLGVSNTP
ncbi:aldo/keto reductase, partial [Streptomyces sp. SID12501]